MAGEMFPERPLWRDIDKVKNTPHMNWGTCVCSQCSIWRIVAQVEDLRARLAEVEAERDAQRSLVKKLAEGSLETARLLTTAESRLAAVLALCDGAGYWHQVAGGDGSGNRGPLKAVPVAEIRARLAEVEAERDSARRTAETYLDKLAELDRTVADIDTAVIRDLYGAEFADGTVYDLCAEVDALRARLAKVEALCESVEPMIVFGGGTVPGIVRVDQVLAAARGEGDR